MKKELFDSMYAQMVPSGEARAELTARLRAAGPVRKKVPVRNYVAVAACAALLVAAYPAYRALAPKAPALHSYVTVEGSDTDAAKQQMTVTGEMEGVDQGMGDRDQAMTPEELVEIMEEAGYTTEEIDAYQALGYQMTWAKWWKFVAQQHDSEGEEPFNLASLEDFSRRELAVNTGDLPGGAYIGDAPSQPGADAYQLLMAHFGGAQPDWYGGAYVDQSGALMVLLVDALDPGDKSLEMEVLDAVGKTAPVAFTNVKYSRGQLEKMNDDLARVLDGVKLPASWGIYDDRNCIVLDFYETPSENVLAALAELDPDGDAILVRVVEGGSAVTDQQVKGPAPMDTVGDEDDGFRESHSVPGGLPVEDDSGLDLEADEPQWDGEADAGEQSQQADYDLLRLDPEEEE